MSDIIVGVVSIALVIAGAVVFWIIGARMFKIKDVIKLEKEILQELKKINLKEQNRA